MAEYSPQAGKIFFYYHMQQIYNKCGVERLGAVLIAYSGNPVHVPGHVTGQTDSCCARLAMIVSRASPLESWWQKSHQKTKPFISIYTWRLFQKKWTFKISYQLRCCPTYKIIYTIYFVPLPLPSIFTTPFLFISFSNCVVFDLPNGT